MVRLPEAEPLMGGDSLVGGDVTISFDISAFAGAVERMAAQFAEIQRTVLNSWVTIGVTADTSVLWFDEPRDWPVETLALTFDGQRVPVAVKSVPELVPPARERDVIARLDELLTPQAPVMPEASWRAKVSRPAASWTELTNQWATARREG
jgi:hypothetical protein